jgi:hypothetical protein
MELRNEKEFQQTLLKYKKVEEKCRNYEDSNKMEFWKPWYHQQRIINFLWEGKKTLLLQGSNRIGKTVLGSCLGGSFALGYQPWDGKESIFGRRPTRGRIICVDWEHHAQEVVVPTLKEWLPRGTYRTKTNNVGVEAIFIFNNGSTIELLTHSQDTRIHEGWKGEWVWSDEPLPRDKYTANKRGLVDKDGVFILTLTALYEPWILDEIALKNDPSVGSVLEIPIQANPLLTPEAIKVFEDSLPDEEVVARIKGGWLQLVGRVVKSFDRNRHVIAPFKVPFDYPVVAMIDTHLSLPQAIGFYTWDKRDIEYVIDETWENLSPEAVADNIISKMKQNTWNIKHVFIDPLAKGDSKYMKQREIEIEDTFSIIERKLAPYGIILHLASKDKSSGVRNLHDRFLGINSIPTLFIFDNCDRHIYEIQRWVYDEEGVPKKQNDHFCENLYRSTLSGIKYTDPKIFSKKLNVPYCGVV